MTKDEQLMWAMNIIHMIHKENSEIKKNEPYPPHLEDIRYAVAFRRTALYVERFNRLLLSNPLDEEETGPLEFTKWKNPDIL